MTDLPATITNAQAALAKVNLTDEVVAEFAELGDAFVRSEGQTSRHQWEIGEAVHEYWMTVKSNPTAETRERIWELIHLSLKSKNPEVKSGLSLSSVKLWARTAHRFYEYGDLLDKQERYSFDYFVAVGEVGINNNLPFEKLFAEIERDELTADDFRARYRKENPNLPPWTNMRHVFTNFVSLLGNVPDTVRKECAPHVDAIEEILDRGEK